MTHALFASKDLHPALQANAKKVADRLVKWDPDALLATAEADVIDELIDDGSVECPQLLRDQVEMLRPEEITVMDSYFDRVWERRFPRFVLVVPFTGERVIFTLRPSQYSGSLPRVLDLRDSELWIAIDEPVGDAATVRAQFEEQLDKIEQHLAWSRTQIEAHNQFIHNAVPDMVAGRRAYLLATRNLQAEIGFPIRRRPDANTYAVPLKRRKIRPVQTAASTAQRPFKPEPAMHNSDYQAVLAVLRSSRNALCRKRHPPWSGPIPGHQGS